MVELLEARQPGIKLTQRMIIDMNIWQSFSKKYYTKKMNAFCLVRDKLHTYNDWNEFPMTS